jgi:hypothetical protein
MSDLPEQPAVHQAHVVVHPVVDALRPFRRVEIRGVQVGKAFNVVDVIEFARRAGLDNADFDSALPGGKDARDIIEHFDEYTQGMGRLQQPKVKAINRQPDEQLAEAFRVDFKWTYSDDTRRPILKVGPFDVDLIMAEDAAVRLHCATYEAISADQGKRLPPGWAYGVQRPDGERKPGRRPAPYRPSTPNGDGPANGMPGRGRTAWEEQLRSSEGAPDRQPQWFQYFGWRLRGSWISKRDLGA